MLKNNLSETLTIMDTIANDNVSSNTIPKTALDYNVLYTLFDILESLGLTHRKNDG